MPAANEPSATCYVATGADGRDIPICHEPKSDKGRTCCIRCGRQLVSS